MKFKINNLGTTLILLCAIVFIIGATFRFYSRDSIEAITEKKLSGFIVLNISNIIKAGLWKMDFKKVKPEMIAKNSISIFRKGTKNAKRYLDPSISPKGQFIAYTLEFNERKSIAIMLNDGTKETSFVELDEDNIEKPSFSPDSKHIAMISANKVYISSYPPEKTLELQSITQPDVLSKALTWASPKFLGYINKNNIFKLVNIETSETKSFGKAEQASFSPDTKMLAISKKKKLLIYPVSTSENNFTIQTKAQKQLQVEIKGKITWAPDNKHILATIKRDTILNSTYQIAIINIETKEKLFFPKNWKASTSHSWRNHPEE